MMLEKLISLIEKIFLSITKIGSTGISTLEAFKFKLVHYNIMKKILIFILYSVILDRPNFIIKLSQG